MASGFRPIVLGEIFRRLPEFVNPARPRDVDLTVGFRLLGNPSGEIERYVVRVRDGVATVDAGDAGEQRDATVTCEGHDYLRLATGHLNPVTGVLKGQLKVRGDKAKALAAQLGHRHPPQRALSCGREAARSEQRPQRVEDELGEPAVEVAGLPLGAGQLEASCDSSSAEDLLQRRGERRVDDLDVDLVVARSG